MGNKMYLIGGYYEFTCEVFDSNSRKYTNINKIEKPDECNCVMSALCIGYKIIIIPRFSTIYYSKNKNVFIYDVLMDQFDLKEYKFANTHVGSCLRIPILWNLDISKFVVEK